MTDSHTKAEILCPICLEKLIVNLTEGCLQQQQKKIAHILSSQDNVKNAAPHPPFCLQNLKNERFFWFIFPQFNKKNRSFLGF